MKGLSQRISKFDHKYSNWILASFLIATLIMVPGLKKITIARGFDHDAFPAFNELVTSVKTVRKTFGANIRQVIISVEASGNQHVTDPKNLKLIQALTHDLKKVRLVKSGSILSIASVKDFATTNDGIETTPVVEKLPVSDQESRLLEQKISQNPFFYGKLISKDFKSAIIVATAYDNADLADIHNQVTGILGPHLSEVPGTVITLVGEPEVNYLVFTSIEKDISLFVILGISLILLSFLLIFRSWQGVLLPFCEILVAIIWTMGLIGYHGVPITLISATLPVVIVVIGSEMSLHLLSGLIDESRKKQTFEISLMHALRRLLSPLTLATLAAFVAGVSLITFKIYPIQHFGVFTGIASLICLFITLFLLPCLYKVLWHSSVSAHRERKNPVGVVLSWVAGVVERYPLGVTLAVPAVVVLAALFIPKIQFGFDNVSFLPDGNPVKATVYRLDEAFGGTQKFDLLLDTKEPSGILDAEFLKKETEFEREALSVPNVTYSFSVVHMLKKLNALLQPNSVTDLPEKKDAISQYLFLLGMSDTGIPLNSLVSTDYQKMKVTINIKAHDTLEANKIYKDLESVASRVFGKKVSVIIGGDLVYSIAMTRYLVWGKIQNILVALLIMFLLVAALQRSLVNGMITVISLPIGAILNFGLMALAGIRLDFVTAIITSFAMGLGVGFAIHFIAGVEEIYHEKKDLHLAIRKGIEGPGRAIVFNCVSNVLGFSVLLLSSFKAIHVFSILMAFNMIALLLLTLFLVPAVLLLVPPEFLTEHRKRNQLKEPRSHFVMKVALSSAAVLFLSFGIYWLDAQAESKKPNAQELVDKATDTVYTVSEEATYVMKLVDGDGKENVRKMHVWFKRDGSELAKLLIKLEEPADLRGTGLLSIVEMKKSTDQWLYLPAIKKSRRIKGGNEDESFLGSDFTVSDLSVAKQDRFIYELQGTKKCGEKECYVLSGGPKPGSDSPYSKKIVELRIDNTMVVRTEFYNQAGQLEKIMSLDGIHREGGKHWMADRLEMKNLLTNHKTLIEVQQRNISKAPSNTVFTQSFLERN